MAVRLAEQSRRARAGRRGKRALGAGGAPAAVSPAVRRCCQPRPDFATLPVNRLAAHLLQNEDQVPGQDIGRVTARLAAEQHLGAVAVAGLNVHLRAASRGGAERSG
jgi:hypothetical protein